MAADVWSVTSYNELRRDALAVERWNRLHPDQPERKPYIVEALKGAEGPIIAASDYMKVVADQIGALAARPPGNARHRRLRPQRQSRIPAAALRDQRRIHRRRGAVAGWPATASSTPPRPGRVRRTRHRHRTHRSRNEL